MDFFLGAVHQWDLCQNLSHHFSIRATSFWKQTSLSSRSRALSHVQAHTAPATNFILIIPCPLPLPLLILCDYFILIQLLLVLGITSSTSGVSMTGRNWELAAVRYGMITRTRIEMLITNILSQVLCLKIFP